MSLSAIILAAGKSMRMKSALPKPLHEICGKPMLAYVLQACYDAGCQRVFVVVGHGKEKVTSYFAADKRIHWVEQTEQLGPGHAVRMCQKELKKQQNGDVFILAGDGPLIRGQVLKTLLQAHHEERAAATLATAVLDDPNDSDRIVRDDKGNFLDIVEQGDANARQREIHEIFPRYACYRVEDLLKAMPKLTLTRKGEINLNPLPGILRRSGRKVIAIEVVTPEEVHSINNRQQQAEVDIVMQDRIQRRLRDQGVTIVSPGATYIEAGVTVGQETIIRPFTFIGRDASIGSDCIIGPFAIVPRQSIVPEGTTIAGNISMEAALLNRGGNGNYGHV